MVFLYQKQICFAGSVNEKRWMDIGKSLPVRDFGGNMTEGKLERGWLSWFRTSYSHLKNSRCSKSLIKCMILATTKCIFGQKFMYVFVVWALKTPVRKSAHWCASLFALTNSNEWLCTVCLSRRLYTALWAPGHPSHTWMQHRSTVTILWMRPRS